MNQAKALFDAGKLNEAIEELLNEVKANPSDAARRTFLFELSCFAGDLDRAERQLDVIGHQSAQAELGVMVYRSLIGAERERRRVFAEGVQPHFLKEPPPYVDQLVAALKHTTNGEYAEARAALDQAEEDRPAIRGKSNDTEFEDFRDYDDFIAPVLELVVKDKYVWMPFEQIKSMKLNPPKQLRDFLWAPASIEALDGTIGEVYVPALYAGTSAHTDDQARLGRMTDWQQIGGDVYRALGLRLFLVGAEEKAFHEVGSVEFYSDAAEATPIEQSATT